LQSDERQVLQLLLELLLRDQKVLRTQLELLFHDCRVRWRQAIRVSIIFPQLVDVWSRMGGKRAAILPLSAKGKHND
jgi:hypothetical protein